jgi:LEA14-like dessication related protein
MKRLLLILVPAALFLVSCNSKNIKEPEYREIQNVRIEEVGLLQTTAGFDMVYYNPNDFSVQLTNARGDIYIDNMFFGRFTIKDKVSVRKHQEFIVPAQVKMDNVSAVKNHREIFQKKQAVIRIEGFATVSKAGFRKELPIKYEGIQDLERLRAIVSR